MRPLRSMERKNLFQVHTARLLQSRALHLSLWIPRSWLSTCPVTMNAANATENPSSGTGVLQHLLPSLPSGKLLTVSQRRQTPSVYNRGKFAKLVVITLLCFQFLSVGPSDFSRCPTLQAHSQKFPTVNQTWCLSTELRLWKDLFFLLP